MDSTENSKWAGQFTVASGKDVFGELTLSGATTSLYLHDKVDFSLQAFSPVSIKGALHDLTKVTLIQCITTSGPGSGRNQEESYCFYTLFPHFVVYGSTHVDPEANSICEIKFTVDDATTLFYDFDAFGSVIDARPLIAKVVTANALPRKVVTGPNPQILYFTGKTKIFTVETSLGTVSASHRPTHSLGGPSGVWLKNTIFISVAFKAPVTFKESIGRVSTLLKYLGVLIGRPQNILGLNVRLESKQERPSYLRVYWSMPPKREASREGEKPHPADVLVNAVRQPEEFSRILENWLSRHDAWCNARLRFFNSFEGQNHFDIDRLIGSANMFDILPDSAAPADVKLADELTAARDAARSIFLPLPTTPERDSVLGALGRIGKASLKQKVRHRVQRVISALPKQFAELQTVTDEAVNCRNYFVHGGVQRFDYGAHFNLVSFFTEALEFVFAASDLLESGWDIAAWATIPTTMSHPFARFRVGYAEHLRELKTILGS